MFDLDLNITNGTVSNIWTAKKFGEILKSWKKDHNNIFFTLMLLHVLYEKVFKVWVTKVVFLLHIKQCTLESSDPISCWLAVDRRKEFICCFSVSSCHRKKKNQYSLFILPNSTLCLSRFKLPVLNVYCNYFFFSSLFMSNEHFFMIAKIFVVWMWFSTEF